MGAAISMPDILTSIPNQATIYDKTHGTVIVMNRVIDFILRNADISDMVSLSTPEGCKKWIVVAESKLDTLFDRFRIQPDIGKDGILYLKKIEDVKTQLGKVGSTSVKSVEHEKYCKVLAFFFVRLFQVVGALALSVIDTELPRENYVEGKIPTQPYQRSGVPFLQKLPPKTFGSSTAHKLKSWVGLGGAADTVLDPYIDGPPAVPIFPQFYPLKSPIVNQQARQPIIPGTQISYGQIINNYFIKKTNNIYTIQNGTIEIDLEFHNNNKLTISNVKDDTNLLPINLNLNYSVSAHIVDVENKNFITFIIYLVNKIRTFKGKPNILIVLSFLNYIDRDKVKNTNIVIDDDPNNKEPIFSITTIAKDEKKTKIKIMFDVDLQEINFKYSIQIKNIKIIPRLAINIGDKLTSIKQPDGTLYGNESGDDTTTTATSGPTRNFTINNGIPTWNNLTIPKYLESQLKALIHRAEKVVVEGVSAMKEGYMVPLSDIKVTENYLRYSELWQELSKKPSIKAFCTARALQLLNLSGLAQTVPTVIQPLVFSTKFPLVINKSVPRRGERIIETPSFKSLQTLYDFPTDIMSTFPKSMQEDTSAKTKSLAQLILAFTENTQPINFEDIREQASTSQTNPTIIDSAKIKALREQAKKLFQEQFIHTKKVGALMKKLFIMDNNITLNPSIMNKGIVGIEEIAREARDLLTDYYSKCQTEYNVGVKILTKV